MKTLTPTEFQTYLQLPGVQLVDVRGADEAAVARLDGASLMPLHELPALFGQLDPALPIAIYCHHGVRSEQAGRFLESKGFEALVHLEGGIDAWSQQIDPTVIRY